ncbi:hypothetical protein QQF64_019916 [Cirrhinus molitorella]|uniref:Uncharacterized protein n=1 Tax=Cirrhinus molitorella TaxID=172907 RepID=A0ABR3LI75_9TELE
MNCDRMAKLKLEHMCHRRRSGPLRLRPAVETTDDVLLSSTQAGVEFSQELKRGFWTHFCLYALYKPAFVKPKPWLGIIIIS